MPEFVCSGRGLGIWKGMARGRETPGRECRALAGGEGSTEVLEKLLLLSEFRSFRLWKTKHIGHRSSLSVKVAQFDCSAVTG